MSWMNDEVGEVSGWERVGLVGLGVRVSLQDGTDDVCVWVSEVGEGGWEVDEGEAFRCPGSWLPYAYELFNLRFFSFFLFFFPHIGGRENIIDLGDNVRCCLVPPSVYLHLLIYCFSLSFIFIGGRNVTRIYGRYLTWYIPVDVSIFDLSLFVFYFTFKVLLYIVFFS